MASQWQRLLKNQGTWVGSFTRLSPGGEVLGDVPSQVSLQAEGDTMHQVIRKQPPGQLPEETVLTYRSLNRSTLFFADGAFSQGSLQLSPLADFGAELGHIYQHERLRLVLLYQRQRQLSQLTLIREHLAGQEPVERSVLGIDQLVGTWAGEAVTLYPDLRPVAAYPCTLELSRSGDVLHQSLSFGPKTIRSTGRIGGSSVGFEQGSQPVTLYLLPGGASATCPTDIVSGQPLFLEAGWLIRPDLRQRMIRSYDGSGTWSHLTLVTERKVA